jgi:hypothetical protein
MKPFVLSHLAAVIAGRGNDELFWIIAMEATKFDVPFDDLARFLPDIIVDTTLGVMAALALPPDRRESELFLAGWSGAADRPSIHTYVWRHGQSRIKHRTSIGQDTKIGIITAPHLPDAKVTDVTTTDGLLATMRRQSAQAEAASGQKSIGGKVIAATAFRNSVHTEIIGSIDGDGDGQRAAIVDRMVERRSEIAKKERARKAVEQRQWHPVQKQPESPILPYTSSGKIAVPTVPAPLIGEIRPLVPHGAATSLNDIEMPAPRREGRDGTRAAAGREHKIPERKMRAVAEIKKHDPAARERIARGETTIIQERAKLNAAARTAVAERTPTVPTGRYSCIVIDPPWQMEKIEREVRAALRRQTAAHHCGEGPRPGRRLPPVAGAYPREECRDLGHRSWRSRRRRDSETVSTAQRHPWAAAGYER